MSASRHSATNFPYLYCDDHGGNNVHVESMVEHGYNKVNNSQTVYIKQI